MPTARQATQWMAEYELSPAAEGDLFEIALYTITTWGVKQAERYEAKLESHFVAIARRDMRSRAFLVHRPELRVSRCEHHYVFFLERENAYPLILAVFHENMDLIARIQGRLDAPADDQGDD